MLAHNSHTRDGSGGIDGRRGGRSAPHDTGHTSQQTLQHFRLTGSGDDPRVGSGRNGSSGGTISTTSNSKSSSLSKLGATFIPVVVFVAVCLLVFVFLRKKCPRIFTPRAVPTLVAPVRPVQALPTGWFSWVIPFFKIKDAVALESGSLDGYLFLRYIKTLRNICFVGCCITWPILLPIHGTGGRGNTQLEMLTMGNVASSKKFYAHALVAWYTLLQGFVLYMVVRECIYYINLRQAYLSSPYFSDRLSSKTVMLTSVPEPYLDESRLRRVYGESARKIWIPRTTKALAKMVKEREQTAERLEKAEIELIKKANAAREKKMKKDRKNGVHHQVEMFDDKPAHLPSTPPLPRSPSKESRRERQHRLSRPATRANSHSSISLPSTPQTSDSQTELQAKGNEDRINVVETQTTDPTGSSETSLELPVRRVTMTNFAINDLPPAPKPKRKPMIDHPDDPEYQHPYGLSPNLPDLRGSVAAQYIPVQARPHHRPIGNWLRRVDTVRWTRLRLQELNLQIYKLRKSIRTGKLANSSSLPAVFIEFETQEAAQAAHQVVAHHRPLQMSTRLLGVRPDEVVWKALRMSWWEKIMRRTLVLGLITAAIVFWSIPCALIGIISNISFLSGIPFLHWLNQLPKPVLSFIQSFIPAMALSLWMSLVPAMMRGLAIQAGVPSLILVELFTQNAYFAFQVVQVFLITTITSAASGALTTILENPVAAKDLLAQNLPKASNFYLSYILIQCMMTGAFNLLHIFELLRHEFLKRISAIPRARYRIWKKLRLIHYGGVFPVFTNLGVIVLCYAIIAPLILIFATGGMAFTHLIWKYNIIYCFDSSMDSRGLFYPRALTQLIIGLYLAEICLIGLFALNLAIGPLLLMVVFFLFTGVMHISIREAIMPLLQNLPQTLALEEEVQEQERAKLNAPEETSGAANDYYDEEQTFGDEDDQIEEEPEDESEDELHGPVTSTRAVEGASGVGAALKEWLQIFTKKKISSEMDASGMNGMLSKLTSFTFSPDSKPNFLTKWLHPEIYEDFVALRKLIPQDFEDPDSKDESRIGLGERAIEYLPPEMWSPKPKLWIPKDDAKVSRQEVDHTGRVIPISDDAAWLDNKGGVYIELEKAPILVPRLLL